MIFIIKQPQSYSIHFLLRLLAKRGGGKEYFRYENEKMLDDFSKRKWVQEIEKGRVYIDFDARTGHNHGTKFRIRSNELTNLYEVVETVA